MADLPTGTSVATAEDYSKAAAANLKQAPRRFALQVAHNPDHTPTQVTDRARAYVTFLNAV